MIRRYGNLRKGLRPAMSVVACGAIASCLMHAALKLF